MRGFDTEEQKQTYEALVESGRDQLLNYGPEKTTVSDVTEPVGIAKSTFYLYFESKADLYLDILNREFENVKTQLDEELTGIEDPTKRLKAIFRIYTQFSEENPFVQQLMAEPDSCQWFKKNVSNERFEQVQQDGMTSFIPYLSEIQDQTGGVISRSDPFVVLGVMAAIGGMVQRKDSLQHMGNEYYDDVQNLLIRSLTLGLTTEEGPSGDVHCSESGEGSSIPGESNNPCQNSR